jgi:nucleoside-diphosphate-sugar epimerase
VRPTVAVTGASGFIGPHIVRRLSRDGWQVRILTRRTVELSLVAPTIERVHGSLDDVESLRCLLDGADAVVHVAGLIRARRRDAFFRANAESVRRLVELAAERPGPPRFVLMSSLAAREPALSDYAASKRAGEDALMAAGDGLPWTILRPPAVYGPGDRATLPFFRCVRHGIGPLLGADGARVSLLHVEDLAGAVGTVLASDRSIGLVAELDDGRPGGHSWPELVSVAAAQLGRRAHVFRVPMALPYSLGLLNAALARLPGYTPMLTPGKVRELYHPDWVCDTTAIMQKTAWRPIVPIEQGFASTIAWYRQERWL